jgi:hypothetical protein
VARHGNPRIQRGGISAAVQSIDDLPSGALKEQFREEPDYALLIKEIQQLKPSATVQAQLVRLSAGFEEIAEIDFFCCPLRSSRGDYTKRNVRRVTEARRKEGCQ